MCCIYTPICSCFAVIWFRSSLRSHFNCYRSAVIWFWSSLCSHLILVFASHTFYLSHRFAGIWFQSLLCDNFKLGMTSQPFCLDVCGLPRAKGVSSMVRYSVFSHFKILSTSSGSVSKFIIKYPKGRAVSLNLRTLRYVCGLTWTSFSNLFQ